MKKFRFHFLAAAALLALAACSSTDESANKQTVAEPKPVNFGTYVNQSVTRAGTNGDITNTNLLKDAQGFGVFAYYTDNVEYSGTTIPNFMYNQQVTSTDGTTWTYTPVKYWPNEYGSTATSEGTDMLSFFAYAPYVAVSTTTGQVTEDNTSGIIQTGRNSTTGDPTVKYIVTGETAGVDLLWGVNASNGLPWLNQTRTAGATGDDKITFTFRHALAKLTPAIKTSIAIDAKTKVYVRSITITGFASKGTLNLNNIEANKPLWYNYDGADLTFDGLIINDGRKDGREGSTEQANEKNKWLNPNLVQSTAWGDEGAKPGVTSEAANLLKNASIYVIPSGGTEAVDVTIIYDVETEDANLSTNLSDGTTKGSSVENRITKTVNFGTPSGFEAGKAYTLNITLGMKDVKVDAAVVDWTAVADTNTNLPE